MKIRSAVWPTKAGIKKNIKKHQQNITWTLAERASITIPNSSRSACASHLADVLCVNVAVAGTTIRLSPLNWSGFILQQSKRGDRRHNLTAVVEKQI